MATSILELGILILIFLNISARLTLFRKFILRVAQNPIPSPLLNFLIPVLIAPVKPLVPKIIKASWMENQKRNPLTLKLIVKTLFMTRSKLESIAEEQSLGTLERRELALGNVQEHNPCARGFLLPPPPLQLEQQTNIQTHPTSTPPI